MAAVQLVVAVLAPSTPDLVQDHTVLVIMNHPIPAVVGLVSEWFAQHGNVVIATPLHGGGDLEFDTGSYLFQGAVVEYLRQGGANTGHTIVVHDDLPLSQHFHADAVLVSEDMSLCHIVQPLGGSLYSDWVWKPRVFASMARSRDEVLGSGLASPSDALRQTVLYKRNSVNVDAFAESTFTWEGDDQPSPLWFSAWLRESGFNESSASIGVPLFYGMSDFFSFPNSLGDAILEFLRVTLECRLFVECAIPTMLAWSGLELRQCYKEVHYDWGQGPHDLRSIDGVEQLTQFFDGNPELIGVHPVKFSRFVRGKNAR